MKEQIRQYVVSASGSGEALNLFELYSRLSTKPSSVYVFVDALLEAIAGSPFDSQSGLILRQADGILASLGDLPDSEKIVALGKSLSINQTGHSFGRYLHCLSCHETFGTDADVVMFGDSITEWAPWHEILSGCRVVNRGIAGDTTKGMLLRAHTVNQVNPDTVFVMAGINDLSQGMELNEVMVNYRKLVDGWLQAGIAVVVQSTLYVGASIDWLNPKVTELNQELQAMCTEKGCRYIDLTQTLCPDGVLSTQFSTDDLHLNGAAYVAWGEVIGEMIGV